jgi:hypothetical protein
MGQPNANCIAKWLVTSIIFLFQALSGCRTGAVEAKKRSEKQVSLGYQRFSDPRTASRFLAEREEARLLGGGTLLVRCANEGDVSIGTYVRLLAPEFQQIEVGNDAVRLGAGVT